MITIASAPPTAQARRLPAVRGIKLQLDPLRLALTLLTIIAVSRVHQQWAPLSRLRPALLLVGFTALYAFLNPRKLELRGLKTWPARLVVAIAVWACLSVPFGISLGGSATFILEEFAKTLVYCFLLVVAIRGARDLYTLVWAYVIGSGILVFLALFVFGLSKSSGSYVTRLGGLHSYDSNDAGLVLLIGLALTLLVFQASRGLPKLASGVVLVGIGAALARTGSRGAFVGLVVVGLALLVMLRTVSVAKRVGFVVVTVVALAIAAPPGYWEQMHTLVNPTRDYNWDAVDGRRAVATRGLDYMMGRPVFGLGINNFWRAECFTSEKVRNHVPGTGIRCTPPHNSFVEAGAETGIPGLVLWSSLVFGGIIAMVRLRRRMPAAWINGDPEQRFLYLVPLYLALAMIGFAVASFFVSFAWLDMVYMLAAFMAGLYLSIQQKLAPPVRVGVRPVRGAGRVPGPGSRAVPDPRWPVTP